MEKFRQQLHGHLGRALCISEIPRNNRLSFPKGVQAKGPSSSAKAVLKDLHIKTRHNLTWQPRHFEDPQVVSIFWMFFSAIHLELPPSSATVQTMAVDIDRFLSRLSRITEILFLLQ